MSHPIVLTPAIQERILTLLRGGNFFETACAAAGVTATAARRWIVHGLHEPDSKEGPFARACVRAMAKSEADLLEGIRKAGEEDWHALAWILTRRSRIRWGDRVAVDIDVKSRTTQELVDEAKQLVADLEAEGVIEASVIEQMGGPAREELDDGDDE